MKPVGILILGFALLTTCTVLGSRKMDGIDYFLKKSGIRKSTFNLNEARNGKLLVTNLDNYRGMFVWARQIMLDQAAIEWKSLIEYNWKMGKFQKPRPKWEKFPCNLNNSRSREPPKTVHELRPGDIDVIAAIGDSISAGNGIISNCILHILMEFRGLAFSGGGMGDWRTTLTLPNILKAFNPKLYGFATNDVLTVNRDSHLNIAEPMLMSRDLVYQANILIARLKRDSHVDFNNHWKLLTILVGNNDICSDLCHHDDLVHFVQRHEDDLRNALALLRDNVPRLVVNLLPVPNMFSLLYGMRNIPFPCEAIHLVGCHCIFNKLYDSKVLERTAKYITRWQAVDEYVANLPEFRTDEFIVLYQPVTLNVSAPKLNNGDEDLRYFASDCFHLSQLGHATLANAVWNNMMQSADRKQRRFLDIFEKFECPTEDKPFIATWKNSRK